MNITIINEMLSITEIPFHIIGNFANSYMVYTGLIIWILITEIMFICWSQKHYYDNSILDFLGIKLISIFIGWCISFLSTFLLFTIIDMICEFVIKIGGLITFVGIVSVILFLGINYIIYYYIKNK